MQFLIFLVFLNMTIYCKKVGCEDVNRSRIAPCGCSAGIKIMFYCLRITQVTEKNDNFNL